MQVKGGERLTAKELLDFYEKNLWCRCSDIMKICGCQHRKAKEILDSINDSRRKKNQYIHDERKVPTTLLFRKVGIDIEELKKRLPDGLDQKAKG